MVLLASGASVYVIGARRMEGTERYSAQAEVLYKSPIGQGLAEVPASTLQPMEIQRQILSDESLAEALNRVGVPLGELQSPQATDAIAKARGQIQVGVQGTAQQPRIAIACTGGDAAETIVLANQLANQFATAERARLAGAASRRHQESQQAAERAQQELASAVARLDGALKQHSLKQSRADESRVAQSQETEPPKPLMIDNPLWLELDRERVALEQRQAQLLVDRTPLHPEVQAVATQIAELREKQARVPRQVPDPSGRVVAAPPKPVQPTVVTEEPQVAGEVAALRVAVEQAKQNAARFAELERQASAQKLAVPQIDLQLAERCHALTRPLTVSLPLLLIALTSGLAIAIGVGMVLASLHRSHPVRTLAELQSLVPVPIVGTILLAEPSRPRKSSRSIVSLVRALTFTYGLTLITVCLLILFMAFTQT